MDPNLTAHIIFQKYFNKIFHRIITPKLGSFLGYPVTSDPNMAVMKVTGTNDITSLPNLREEFYLLSQTLNERYRKAHLEYPLNLRSKNQHHISCIQLSESSSQRLLLKQVLQMGIHHTIY